MNSVELPLTLGTAFALLAIGALLGDLWARLRSSRGESRAGERPHYLLGLNYLVSNQPTAAIRELGKAVRQETDAVEAYLALGNLLRENGQTERAIDVHKSLLHRADLSDWQRTQVLLSLGMDFKKAGLIDRAERTFAEVAERDPENVACLAALQRINEETGRWEEAVAVQGDIQRITQGSEDDLLPSLQSEWGRAVAGVDPATGEKRLREALERRPDYAAAHMGLGMIMLQTGRLREALEQLEQVVAAGTPWAGAALDPMARACERLGDFQPLARACRQTLERDPRSWRAHLAWARLRMREGDLSEAAAALGRALKERPGSLAVQRELWELLKLRGQGIDEFIGMLDTALEDARLVDPFVCLRCRFKSAELMARCPHCHEWNSMNEERQD